MIRVTASSPFMSDVREFKAKRGIETYLRRLKRLHRLHLQAAEKEIDGKLTDKEKKNLMLNVSIVHV